MILPANIPLDVLVAADDVPMTLVLTLDIAVRTMVVVAVDLVVLTIAPTEVPIDLVDLPVLVRIVSTVGLVILMTVAPTEVPTDDPTAPMNLGQARPNPGDPSGEGRSAGLTRDVTKRTRHDGSPEVLRAARGSRAG